MRGMKLSIQARGLARWLTHPLGRVVLALVWAGIVVGGIVLIHYYDVYAAVIDARLSAPIFSQTSLLYAAPRQLQPGEDLSAEVLQGWLQEAGYAPSGEASPVGNYQIKNGSVAIRPGPEAPAGSAAVTVSFQTDPVAGASVTGIVNDADQQALGSYALAPEVLTTLFDSQHEKRRLVHYSDLPPMLVQAVLDIEDRDYFHHGAVNWYRVPAAMFRDVRSGRREQGASTLTMQVARTIFDLGMERTFKRKLTETLLAMELEQRLTKEQIFELYANRVYLGQRGISGIQGFGAAANAYFGKDVSQLTLPECALLAGIIHGPNLDSPYRHPQRALRRRNEVLAAMARAGAITDQQAAAAEATALGVTGSNSEASDAPYFVDMVRDRISDQIPENDLASESFRIYSTLDPDLQAAAAQAVADGMKGVDTELAALRARQRHHAGDKPQERAQAALVAIDPHTGAVLALVGGRNYAQSQLNHALAERPTGSIFKPFVYATALESGLLPNLPAITQTSMLLDAPTTFTTPDGKPYSPANFENKYYGNVTLRVALEHSLNNATISLAEQVGLQAVTDLAHAAGIVNAQPTPSEAIGTYTATPLQMASAYTIFANGGMLEPVRLVNTVQSGSGDVVYQPHAVPKPVLDPRVAFLTTNLMESVLDAGTGVQVRAQGFDDPAAGKTGSSHDAWFAGFTNNLLCIVWVGLDNYQNLNIEGAHAALPIWTKFMKAAVKLPAYRNVQPFTPPPGVVAVKIDTVSQQLATPLCPPAQVETDYYLEGTQPKESCQLHPTMLTPKGIIAGTLNLFHITHPAAPPAPVTAPAAAPTQSPTASPASAPKPAAPADKAKPKRGFFGKLLHALGGGSGGNGGTGY